MQESLHKRVGWGGGGNHYGAIYGRPLVSPSAPTPPPPHTHTRTHTHTPSPISYIIVTAAPVRALLLLCKAVVGDAIHHEESWGLSRAFSVPRFTVRRRTEAFLCYPVFYARQHTDDLAHTHTPPPPPSQACRDAPSLDSDRWRNFELMEGGHCIVIDDPKRVGAVRAVGSTPTTNIAFRHLGGRQS